MKKRLRKKFHKGEFQELGFRVLLKINLQDQKKIDNFIDELQDYYYDFGMSACGGCCSSEDNPQIYEFGLLFSAKKGSLNENHRKIISDWCSKKKDIIDFKISELYDLWHEDNVL